MFGSSYGLGILLSFFFLFLFLKFNLIFIFDDLNFVNWIFFFFLSFLVQIKLRVFHLFLFLAVRIVFSILLLWHLILSSCMLGNSLSTTLSGFDVEYGGSTNI